MAGFNIESGVPIPPKQDNRCKYPWSKLAEGDSFLVPLGDEGEEVLLKRMRHAVWMRNHRHHSRYHCEAVDGGVRVWRVG